MKCAHHAALATTVAIAIFSSILNADEAAPVPDNPAATQTSTSRATALAAWKQAKFGLFMHWGVYSIYGGTYKGKELWSAEWIQENAKIPFDEYAAVAAEWNPSKFDADAWVTLAKNAGMGYIVITAKHHDGFAIYPSKASSYNLMNWSKTYKGPDPLAALRDACRKHGLLFGIYYSPLEFRLSKKGFHKGDAELLAAGFKYETLGPKPYASNADVVKMAEAQIKELAEWYQPDILWFDGTWNAMGDWSEGDARQALETIRKAVPNVLINNRLGTKDVDFNTVEGKLPETAPKGTWEYCWNLGVFWGYNPRNYTPERVGTPERYIETLVQVTSMGGNYLLNVGPRPDGTFHPMAIEYLTAIGQWTRVNGECVYGASPAPFAKPAWGYATSKEDKLYLIIKTFPESGIIEFPALPTPAERAYVLSDPNHSPLKLNQSEAKWSVELTTRTPFTVVAIELKK